MHSRGGLARGQRLRPLPFHHPRLQVPSAVGTGLPMTLRAWGVQAPPRGVGRLWRSGGAKELGVFCHELTEPRQLAVVLFQHVLIKPL
jgi:hypothetical protein